MISTEVIKYGALNNKKRIIPKFCSIQNNYNLQTVKSTLTETSPDMFFFLEYIYHICIFISYYIFIFIMFFLLSNSEILINITLPNYAGVICGGAANIMRSRSKRREA